MPGFRDYSGLEISPNEMMSISAWESHAEAEEAVTAAAEWVAANMANLVKRTYTTSASTTFWVGKID